MGMLRRMMLAIVGALCVLLAGCGAADAGQSSDNVVNASTTSQPAAIVEAIATLAATEATGRTRPQASSTETSMARTVIEQAVIHDLAKYLNVTANQITVTEAAERTWPDQGLGCNTPQGVFEPAPTAGFLVTLQHNNETYAYHTDAQGRFVRCVDAGKPLGPITR